MSIVRDRLIRVGRDALQQWPEQTPVADAITFAAARDMALIIKEMCCEWSDGIRGVSEADLDALLAELSDGQTAREP